MLKPRFSSCLLTESLAFALSLALLVSPARAADQKRDSVLTDADLSALAEHFVIVKFHFKRSEEASVPDENGCN